MCLPAIYRIKDSTWLIHILFLYSLYFTGGYVILLYLYEYAHTQKKVFFFKQGNYIRKIPKTFTYSFFSHVF